MRFLSIIALLSFATYSSAQGPQGKDRKKRPTYTQLLVEMDTNKDGKLEKSELKGPIQDDFIKIDTNKDGFISEEEFLKAPKPKRRPRD